MDRSTTTRTRPGGSRSRARCAGEEARVIDFQVLVITLGILLGIVALTTVAAIANKVYSTREESTKKAFLDRVRQSLLLLRTGIPDDHEEGMRRIVHSFSGRWSE